VTRIFDELITDWHHATDRLHHHQGQPAYDQDHNQQGETMSLTSIQRAIEDGIGNIEGWAADLKTHLPEIAAKAAQIDQSPIVQALEGVFLPPEDEAAIAAIIGRFAAAHQAAQPVAVPVTEQPAEAQPVA
jgi:hypothetical protein